MFVVIVAGSRSFNDLSLMYSKLDYYLQKQDKVLIQNDLPFLDIINT